MAIRIFIDQGHNPQNPNAGSEGNGLREQDITYDIGNRLAQLLRQNGNFDVRTSRTSPTQILGTSNATSLQARVNAANQFGADAFISIHTNASENASASGAEALVYQTGTAASRLAEDILTSLTRQTGLRDRGVKARPGLYVLRRTAMPAVLVETGFITNAGDASILTDRADDVARGIYNGILEYYGLR